MEERERGRERERRERVYPCPCAALPTPSHSPFLHFPFPISPFPISPFPLSTTTHHNPTDYFLSTALLFFLFFFFLIFPFWALKFWLTDPKIAVQRNGFFGQRLHRYRHLIHLAAENMFFLSCWYGGQEVFAIRDFRNIWFNISSPFVKKVMAEKMFEFRVPLVDT